MSLTELNVSTKHTPAQHINIHLLSPLQLLGNVHMLNMTLDLCFVFYVCYFQLPNAAKEVNDVDDDGVRLLIERVLISVIRSIMQGEGFEYVVPQRGNANQLYVAELDRNVLGDKVTSRPFASLKVGSKTVLMTRVLQLVYELCVKRIHVTKRDLFYTDVKLFVEQTKSDDTLDDVACTLGCTRSSLNVVAAEKGIVVGHVQFKDDGDEIDCTKMGVGGKAIPPNIDRVTDIRGNAKFILLVEKVREREREREQQGSTECKQTVSRSS